MSTRRDVGCPGLVGCSLFVRSACQDAQHGQFHRQDVISIVRVSRASLGICASSRGTIIGSLKVKSSASGEWADLSSTGAGAEAAKPTCCPSLWWWLKTTMKEEISKCFRIMSVPGLAIPGCTRQISQWKFQSDAQHIIVIEKDAIFQRLTDDRLFDIVPCILVTAKGMPDLYDCNAVIPLLSFLFSCRRCSSLVYACIKRALTLHRVQGHPGDAQGAAPSIPIVARQCACGP